MLPTHFGELWNYYWRKTQADCGRWKRTRDPCGWGSQRSLSCWTGTKLGSTHCTRKVFVGSPLKEIIKPSFLNGLLLTSMTGNLTRCLILTRKACGLVWTVTLVSSPSPRRYVRSASLVFHSSESVWHNALSVTADDAIQLLTTGKASKILLRMHFSQKLTHSKSIITYCLRLFIWMTKRCLDQSLGHFKQFKLHLTVIQKWNAGPPYKVS